MKDVRSETRRRVRNVVGLQVRTVVSTSQVLTVCMCVKGPAVRVFARSRWLSLSLMAESQIPSGMDTRAHTHTPPQRSVWTRQRVCVCSKRVISRQSRQEIA